VIRPDWRASAQTRGGDKPAVQIAGMPVLAISSPVSTITRSVSWNKAELSRFKTAGQPRILPLSKPCPFSDRWCCIPSTEGYCGRPVMVHLWNEYSKFQNSTHGLLFAFHFCLVPKFLCNQWLCFTDSCSCHRHPNPCRDGRSYGNGYTISNGDADGPGHRYMEPGSIDVKSSFGARGG
jgi:hypothetical protein